ncbi:MAG: sigma-54 dependent transcriptional regulator, partial [bacterium]
MTNKVLLVEDDPDQQEMLHLALTRLGYEVAIAEDANQALETAQTLEPDIFLIDLNLPGRDGFSLCADLNDHPRFSLTPRIIVTAEDALDIQTRGLLEYADDYVTKPFDFQILAARIEALLRRAKQHVSEEAVPFEAGGGFSNGATSDYEELPSGLIGACAEMREIFSILKKFAANDAPVLLTGESGTGKELAAHTIHHASSRAGGPFVAINCSAIPENLIEAELFGYEKGAFTGAVSRKEGKVEMAQGGTLFLDEVGELPFALQVKLLRFLEDFRFERVGGIKTMRVDVRVVAATNKDLEKAIAAGEFREDLYYRLAVLALSLPPLRERGEDKMIIAQNLFKRFTQESNLPLKGFTEAALDALRAYPWPGNVRELVNCIRRSVVMAEGELIDAEDLGLKRQPVMAPETPA